MKTSTESPIHIRLQRTFWQLLSGLLRGVVVFGTVIEKTFRVVGSPIRWLGRVFFVLVLVTLYKLYLVLKMRVVAVWRPAKNRLLFPLASRYVLHATLILLFLFVTANSIQAREARNGNVAQPLVLSGILRSDESAEIVEKADAVSQKNTFHRGIGGVSPLDVATPSDTALLATATQETSSFVKPALTSTSIGERPRDGVVYHEVQGGETVGSIAQEFGVSVNTILWENKLGSHDYIQPGQRLTILPVTGISHQVKSGDTVTTIAQKYGTDASEILTYNKIADTAAIAADQIIIVPNGKMPAPPAPTAPRFATTTGGYSTDAPPQGFTAPSGGKLFWPTSSHRINQYYTYRHHGIDIDGDYSSPIYAAEDGRVVTAGWGSGYGLHIIVDSDGGVQTVYGHASKIFVKAGQVVHKGQTIAMQGMTGWATGVHLHFEVRINGRLVNPFSHL
ncbi:MAG: peptidoglycan DD-metalloendopeptidase family protein [bacterium]